MSKKPSTFFNMVTTLFGVALISSAGVGLVYEVTKAPIAQAQLAKKVSAVREVVPEFNNDPIAEAYELSSDIGPLTAYPARKDGVLVGVAIETITQKGFGGEVKLMVGLKTDGAIQAVQVLEHKETPGLGDKMDPAKSDFMAQFRNKNPAKFRLMVKKDGGDVDAITAATISSRAVCDAVQRAYNAFEAKLQNS